MKRKISPKDELNRLVYVLMDDRDRWNEIYENGTSDPFYCDGANLNLVRNHIIYGKRQIKAFVTEHPELTIPEEVNSVFDPDEVPDNYMANPEKIIKEAKESLALYERDENYLYLLSINRELSDKEREKTSISAVLGYHNRLVNAIANNDLVLMRLHRKGSTFQESFKTCAEKVKKCISERKDDEQENVQLSLFE